MSTLSDQYAKEKAAREAAGEKKEESKESE